MQFEIVLDTRWIIPLAGHANPDDGILARHSGTQNEAILIAGHLDCAARPQPVVPLKLIREEDSRLTVRVNRDQKSNGMVLLQRR